MNIQFPQIDIATTSDGLIELEQQNGLDEPDRIVLHPLHIRTMAEQIGLIAPAPETAPDLPTYAEQARDIDRLKRNMLRLREHALQTQEAMRCADWDHADLSHEMMMVNGMVDLCDMAVDDFADDYTARDPKPIEPKRCPPDAPVQQPAQSRRSLASADDQTSEHTLF